MAEPALLVSVHDVMPETLPAVREIVELLDANSVGPLTLLVVPGLAWDDAGVAWLRERQRRGDELAGHGWHHRAGPPRGLYDRLHRRLFSRGVAEHLALDADGIERLIARCHDWFRGQGLGAPAIYVPPAWAMGSIGRKRLREELPFVLYESLGGFYDTRRNQFRFVPLVGFEADTGWRAAVLRAFNALNAGLARHAGRLRVAIHPHDLRLRLGPDLLGLIARSADYRLYK